MDADTADSILRGITDEWPYDSTLIAELDGLRAVVAAYRNAQIVSREFDEGDDEMEEAWRAAWLAHVAFDPSLARCPDGCGHQPHEGTCGFVDDLDGGGTLTCLCGDAS